MAYLAYVYQRKRSNKLLPYIGICGTLDREYYIGKVGKLNEKLRAALNNGIKVALIPKSNSFDLDKHLEIQIISYPDGHINEVISHIDQIITVIEESKLVPLTEESTFGFWVDSNCTHFVLMFTIASELATQISEVRLFSENEEEVKVTGWQRWRLYKPQEGKVELLIHGKLYRKVIELELSVSVFLYNVDRQEIGHGCFRLFQKNEIMEFLGGLIKKYDGKSSTKLVELKKSLPNLSANDILRAIKILRSDGLMELEDSLMPSSYTYVKYGGHFLNFDPENDVKEVLAEVEMGEMNPLAREPRGVTIRGATGYYLQEILGFEPIRINNAAKFLKDVGFVKWESIPSTAKKFTYATVGSDYIFEAAVTTLKGKAYLEGPSQLNGDDIKDPVSLAICLRDVKDPLSRYLRGRFRTDTRRQIDETSLPLIEGSLPPSVVHNWLWLLAWVLAMGLNESLDQDISIYDEQRFAHVTLTKETRKLMEQNPQFNDLRRLNWLLLAEAYPHEISKGPDNRYMNG